MLRVTVERLAEDGTAPEHFPVDVRLSRHGRPFTATAIADWDGPALRRETDTASEALLVLRRRAHRSS